MFDGECLFAQNADRKMIIFADCKRGFEHDKNMFSAPIRTFMFHYVIDFLICNSTFLEHKVYL